MRRSILILTVMAIMASCGNSNGEKTTNEQNAPTTEATGNDSQAKATKSKVDPKDEAYLISRVQAIYDKVFGEYNRANENEEMPQFSPDEDFCSKDWNSMLQKIEEYDAANNPDEIGFFDADYWVMGQDFADLSISDIQVVKQDGDDAEVEFILHNQGDKIKVKLEMEFERGDWYIDNFIDLKYDLNWKEDMKEYLKQ